MCFWIQERGEGYNRSLNEGDLTCEYDEYMYGGEDESLIMNERGKMYVRKHELVPTKVLWMCIKIENHRLVAYYI